MVLGFGPDEIQLRQARAARFSTASALPAKRQAAHDLNTGTPAQPKPTKKVRLIVKTNRTTNFAQKDGTGLNFPVIVGTSTALEKDYLRLTTQPEPSAVRPLHVLRKSLILVKKRWKELHDYEITVNQLRSIRQDITVQHLSGPFVVEVYETHGRIAIEQGDLEQLLQCQTQLDSQYDRGVPGQKYEFLSYRIIQALINQVVVGKWDVGFNRFMQRVQADPVARANPCIIFSKAVFLAIVSDNYIKFFQLWQDAPRMCGYLLDLIVAPVRLRALRRVCAAFRPHLAVAVVQQQLAFISAKECVKFLKEYRAVVVAREDGSKDLDTKQSHQQLRAPAPVAAVPITRKEQRKQAVAGLAEWMPSGPTLATPAPNAAWAQQASSDGDFWNAMDDKKGKKQIKKLKKERNQLKQQLKNLTGKAAKKTKKKIAEVNAKLTKAGGA